MNPARRLLRFFCAVVVFLFVVQFECSASTITFKVTLPAGNRQPVTGRVFVMIARADNPEPRLQVGSWRSHTEFLGIDVQGLQPGQSITLDTLALSYPLKSIREIPPGDYYVQALLNVYTRFPRADGNTIWAHMDQWEGQQFNKSPGNLYSEVGHFHLDPLSGYEIRLTLDKTIPAVQVPEDTQYVKHIKIQSKLLTQFWGQPIWLGATVLLPEGYDAHPNAHYPVLYEQGHFNLRPPLGFSTEPAPDAPQREGRISGGALFKRWTSPGFPRMIAITFQHPTVYFDDSYAVNSANNGPYGDAITQELIPYVEKQFRGIGQGWARSVYGGSTGGWESLASQVFYPDMYNGAWISCPDVVDFRAYVTTNLYQDKNAYFIEGHFGRVPRPEKREADGLVLATMEQANHYELVMGTHGRSGEQFDIWQATFSPIGSDGYPKPIYDKLTGAIDHDVANYWKEHYDLSAIMQRDWKTLGPKLAGKLHFYVGESDTWYLDRGVHLLHDFLETTTDPYYHGTLDFGVRQPHCYSGQGDSSGPAGSTIPQRFLPEMVKHMEATAPKGADLTSWKY
jgi:hypothetical protein